jgi:hypothetical protein
MRNLKTHEGFFDFFKRKKCDSISIEHVMDFLLPITDCEDIRLDLLGSQQHRKPIEGIYTSTEKLIGNKSYYSDKIFTEDGWFHIIKTWDQFRNEPKDITKIMFFHLQYSPVEITPDFLQNSEFDAISDEKVDEVMKEVQYYMEGICKLTFFIGFGGNEGWSSDKEFNDIKTMIKKNKNGRERSIRNIIVKIEAPGGIEI